MDTVHGVTNYPWGDRGTWSEGTSHLDHGSLQVEQTQDQIWKGTLIFFFFFKTFSFILAELHAGS